MQQVMHFNSRSLVTVHSDGHCAYIYLTHYSIQGCISLLTSDCHYFSVLLVVMKFAQLMVRNPNEFEQWWNSYLETRENHSVQCCRQAVAGSLPAAACDIWYFAAGIVGEVDGDDVYIWTHKKFDIGYNGKHIVDVNLTSESKVKLQLNAELKFTYEVFYQWAHLSCYIVCRLGHLSLWFPAFVFLKSASDVCKIYFLSVSFFMLPIFLRSIWVRGLYRKILGN